MKITVINGSPKQAALSVTQRTVTLLSGRFPDHTWQTVSPGPRLTPLQREAVLLPEWLEAVSGADLIIWATPVYYLTVPAQLQRFCAAAGADPLWRQALAGKTAAVLTTSIHFYDHLAVDWMETTAEDLDMQLLQPLCLEMTEVTKAAGRARITAQFQIWEAELAGRTAMPRRSRPLEPYTAHTAAPGEPCSTDPKRTVALLTDAAPGDRTLQAMIDRFCNSAPFTVAVHNLHDLKLQGGCLGCMHCGWDNTCVYRDGLKEFITEQCLPADGLVFALRSEGRGFSTLFKAFRDRSFVFNHVPYFKDKPTVFLISGPLQQLPGLQEVIFSTCETGHMAWGGSISDELPEGELEAQLDAAAKRLDHMITAKLPAQETFRSTGAAKIFRDFVYLEPVFRMDRSYYRKNRLFDFPQKKRGLRLAGRMMRILLHLPGFRRQVYGKMPSFVVQRLDRSLKGRCAPVNTP